MTDEDMQGSEGGSAEGGTEMGGEGQEQELDQVLEGAIVHRFTMKSRPTHTIRL